MTEQDERRWGDPAAPFPYNLSREEYARQMQECHQYGLTDDQFEGRACVYCGVTLVVRGKVGEVQHRDVYGCPACQARNPHPAWCAREHPPFVPGSEWLDLREHEGEIGEMTTTVPHEHGSISMDITATAHPDDDSMSDPYVAMYVGNDATAMTAADLRRLAALALDAADRLDGLTS